MDKEEHIQKVHTDSNLTSGLKPWSCEVATLSTPSPTSATPLYYFEVATGITLALQHKFILLTECRTFRLSFLPSFLVPV